MNAADNEHKGNFIKNKTLFQSFHNAFNGFRLAIVSERNMRIHLSAALAVVVLGILLRIDLIRWGILMLTVGMVLISELLNTSLEKLTDMVTSEYSDEAKQVKDIAATAVLMAAIVSVIVGILVFYGPVSSFFGSLR